MPLLPILVALLAGAPAAEAADDDFAPVEPGPSIALGPVGARHSLVAADVGWLRSGVRAALGAGPALDVTLRADAFLLKALLREQQDVMFGVAWSPASEGLLRASLGAEVGMVLFGGGVPPTSTFALRGQAAVGLALDGIATPYVRAAIRFLSYRLVDRDGFVRDEEVGGGVERAFGPYVVGAEAFVWARPGLAGLGQWRISAGRRF